MILLDSVTAFPADFLMIGYTVYITEIMSAARKNVPTQIADFIVIASVSGYKTPAAVGTPRGAHGKIAGLIQIRYARRFDFFSNCDRTCGVLRLLIHGRLNPCSFGGSRKQNREHHEKGQEKGYTLFH